MTALATAVAAISGPASAEEPPPGGEGEASGWSATFELRDYLNLYDFPEQLVSYELTFPDDQVQAGELRLRTEGGDFLAHQFSDVVLDDQGFLQRARVHFATDLPKGAVRRFTLLEVPDAPKAPQPLSVHELDATRAEIVARNQRVRVPHGDHRFPGDGVHPSEAPAPILAVAGEDGQWIGEGSFEAPGTARVESIRTSVLERGPLFLAYEINYGFDGGRRYRVVLTVREGEAFVTVDEYLEGFEQDDDVRLRFSYLEGLDPEGRLNMGNGGYNGDRRAAESGAYDLDLEEDGRLPTHLTVYAVNSLGANRAQAFWRDDAENALLFCVYRAPEWRTSERHVWNMIEKPENLYFYQRDGDKFMQTRLVGEQRHWALGVIPREDLVIDRPSTGETVLVTLQTDFSEADGAGPEVRMWQRLSDLSLDRIKDLNFEWDESVDTQVAIPALLHREPYREPWTYEDFLDRFKKSFNRVVDYYWDVSGELGGNHFGWVQERSLPEYSFAREHWTPEERQHVRALLVLLPHFQNMDSAMPHRSMMSGHPNFVGAMKQSLGLAPGVFPNHPDAEKWKQAYTSFFDEYLDVYVRKPSPEINALGGRWMENVTCYNFASLEAAGNAMYGLHAYDGTWLFDNPDAEAWLNWNMHVLVPFYQGRYRIAPPQGAHARVHEVEPGGRWHENTLDVARLAARMGSRVGAELLWSLTEGAPQEAEGIKPDLRSQVFTDYGVVLRYDFGGPNEAYLNIQELAGRGYRWTDRANGSLIYAAKGRQLSWNAMETSGDRYDHERLTLFNLDGQSIGTGEGHNVLYNFGGVQFYLAEGDNPDYTGRGVMMVRDDYLAIYDHVTGTKRGEFQWVNEHTGLQVHYFDDANFEREVDSRVDDRRFPIAQDWDEGTPVPGVTGDAFSVRWNGRMTPPHAEEVELKFLSRGDSKPVGENDRARLWIDGELILDTDERDTTTFTFGSRAYDVRVDYSHRGGDDARVHLTWDGGETHHDPIGSRYFLYKGELPEIHAVKDGAGDQMHIVAPESQAVSARPWGAVVNNAEYVVYAPEPVSLREGDLTFEGRIGYAREGELALFEGEQARYGDLAIQRRGGTFGISVKRADSGRIEGHFAGEQGGMVTLTLPEPPPRNASVLVAGEPVASTIEGPKVSFPVEITPRDGSKGYVIEGTARGPVSPVPE